jgi:hypothetical protein
MCSNDSPSEIADGTPDAATLAADYEQYLLDVEEQPLPSYRAAEIRARIEEVRGTLAAEEVASAGQLQQLLCTVTEALADVRAARVVAAPPERDLSAAVPGAADTGAAYEVTATEQRKATNLLLDVLFTVVETPTHEDRRRAVDARGDTGNAADAGGDAGDAGDNEADTAGGLGVDGYAGPE